MPGGAYDRSVLEDLEAIRRLTYQYAFYNDTFQIDALVALFVEDGVFDLSGAGLRRYEGHDGIRHFFQREQQAMSHLMHVTTNHLVELDGDQATGTVYFLGIGVSRDGRESQARGYYDDRYVRTVDGWRFRSRATITLLPFEPIKP